MLHAHPSRRNLHVGDAHADGDLKVCSRKPSSNYSRRLYFFASDLQQGTRHVALLRNSERKTINVVDQSRRYFAVAPRVTLNVLFVRARSKWDVLWDIYLLYCRVGLCCDWNEAKRTHVDSWIGARLSLSWFKSKFSTSSGGICMCSPLGRIPVKRIVREKIYGRMGYKMKSCARVVATDQRERTRFCGIIERDISRRFEQRYRRCDSLPLDRFHRVNALVKRINE